MKIFIMIISMLAALAACMSVIDNHFSPTALLYSSLVENATKITPTKLDKMIIPKGTIFTSSYNGKNVVYLNTSNCGATAISQIYPGDNIDLFTYSIGCSSNVFKKLTYSELDELLTTQL